jgi:hypothetical protein
MIKQVASHEPSKNISKNKNKLSIIIPSKIIANISIGKYKHKRNIIISKIISSKISNNKQSYQKQLSLPHT